jgi:hypothetical protein
MCRDRRVGATTGTLTGAPAVGALETPLGAALPDGLAVAVVLADDDGA